MTDTDVELSEIAEHELPFGRRVRLVSATYESGLRMLRVNIREGRRITQIEVDPDGAEALAANLMAWAKTSRNIPEN